jgi:hypothetical protein
MIVTGGTQRTINVSRSPECPVFAEAQKYDMHEAVVKAAIVPNRAPHPIDPPIVLPMLHLRWPRQSLSHKGCVAMK